VRHWLAGDASFTVGLALTRDSATLAVSHGGHASPAPQMLRRAPLGIRLYEGDPPADAGESLAAVLARLRAELRRGPLPLQISLPDPAVSLQFFEFDAWPARRSEREMLVSWRFAKALALDRARLACGWQRLGRSPDHPLVLATATERRWLDLVLSACREAGFVPTVADMNANFYFNGFYDQWPPGEHGALLIVESASWALMLWDDQRRPRFLRSRWRDSVHGADYDSIAADSERQVRAYVHGGPGRRIARIMVAGGESAALMDRLGYPPRFPCVALDAAQRFAVGALPAADWQGDASAAWMASLPR
jgi:hypothetical protein